MSARPPSSATPKGPFQGYIDERSVHHVAGWMRDLSDAAVRLPYEVVVEGDGGERVVHRGASDLFSPILVQVGVGDGGYAFFAMMDPPLSPEERDRVFVRPAGTAHRLELAPEMRTEFNPVSHLAMDIVNNCNLRCPFCVFDYAGVRATRTMTDETFEAALRLAPFVTDGNFWLSCLHEATLHPRLQQLIERVPDGYRRKVFYTTNLAKRMPPAHFEFLAEAGLHHLNVSLESLRPELYERMREGARHHIFAANWAAMLDAFARGRRPPRLRYNIMAYRSNLSEIPELVETLLREKQAWQVEIRHTYDMPHIPREFRLAEFMSPEEWDWLAERLARHDPETVLLLRPPEGAGHRSHPEIGADGAVDPTPLPPPPPPSRLRIPRPFNLAMDWDGALRVYGEVAVPGRQPALTNYVMTNINYLPDPIRFLLAL